MKDRKLKRFFEEPATPTHRQYEALRAYYLEPITQKEAAEQFGYAHSTLQTLVKRFKRGEIVFFPPKKKGPKKRHTPEPIKNKIVELRLKNMSSPEIRESLKNEGFSVGVRTVERILKDERFSKLPRRTRAERGLTDKKTLIPEKTRRLKFAELDDERFDCQVAGIYLFIPYMLEMGLADLINGSSFPESEQLSKLNSVYSILASKLIGYERLSHINNYSFDNGFGLFAGLNVLPKSTAISTYSYLIDKESVMDFQKRFVAQLDDMDDGYYNGETINLDFHTIPHYGDDPPLENNWVGSKNKSMKGALTFLAQDGESKMISYTNTDIDRSSSAKEVLNFVNYWQGIRGVIDQTLVFDSRLTNYDVLEELNANQVKFITLRRRGVKLIENAYSLPEDQWVKVKLDIPKRKYSKFLVYEHTIPLPRHNFDVREMIIRDHGRQNPTFMITNNFEIELDTLVEHYAHRWRIENKISELVDFFNLNKLSSPLMIRIYFDVLTTLIADTCYKLFANDLPRFESNKSKGLFKKFINTPGKIKIDGDQVMVKLRKKAHTPILKSNPVFQKTYNVPWWDGKSLSFKWSS